MGNTYDRRLSNAAVNAQANALAVLANSGYIRFYTGTRPATADTAIGAQVLLAELRFGADAFADVVAGVLTANAITQDSAANATGVPSWARILQSDGSSVLWDDEVGTATANIILSGLIGGEIVAGGPVSITSLTHTMPKSA